MLTFLTYSLYALVGGGCHAGVARKYPLVVGTHASWVPTQLWRLLAQPLEGMTLKGVLLGGAMIPEVLTEKAAGLGIHCWCGYGLTELASTLCAKRADTRPGVGLPLDGCEIKLVNQEISVRAQSLRWAIGGRVICCRWPMTKAGSVPRIAA